MITSISNAIRESSKELAIKSFTSYCYFDKSRSVAIWGTLNILKSFCFVPWWKELPRKWQNSTVLYIFIKSSRKRGNDNFFILGLSLHQQQKTLVINLKTNVWQLGDNCLTHLRQPGNNFDTKLTQLSLKFDTKLTQLWENFYTSLRQYRDYFETNLAQLWHNFHSTLTQLRQNCDTTLKDLWDIFDTSLTTWRQLR